MIAWTKITLDNLGQFKHPDYLIISSEIFNPIWGFLDIILTEKLSCSKKEKKYLSSKSRVFKYILRRNVIIICFLFVLTWQISKQKKEDKIKIEIHKWLFFFSLLKSDAITHAVCVKSRLYSCAKINGSTNWKQRL